MTKLGQLGQVARRDVGYWARVAGSLTKGGGCPNEDLDVRDHRHARCGADRPAIIQTGTETVPTKGLLGARP